MRTESERSMYPPTPQFHQPFLLPAELTRVVLVNPYNTYILVAGKRVKNRIFSTRRVADDV